MSQFYQCPDCGANLDPGERCDCKKEKKERDQQKEQQKEKYNMSALENNRPNYGRIAI